MSNCAYTSIRLSTMQQIQDGASWWRMYKNKGRADRVPSLSRIKVYGPFGLALCRSFLSYIPYLLRICYVRIASNSITLTSIGKFASQQTANPPQQPSNWQLQVPSSYSQQHLPYMSQQQPIFPIQQPSNWPYQTYQTHQPPSFDPNPNPSFQHQAVNCLSRPHGPTDPLLGPQDDPQEEPRDNYRESKMVSQTQGKPLGPAPTTGHSRRDKGKAGLPTGPLRGRSRSPSLEIEEDSVHPENPNILTRRQRTSCWSIGAAIRSDVSKLAQSRLLQSIHDTLKSQHEDYMRKFAELREKQIEFGEHNRSKGKPLLLLLINALTAAFEALKDVRIPLSTTCKFEISKRRGRFRDHPEKFREALNIMQEPVAEEAQNICSMRCSVERISDSICYGVLGVIDGRALFIAKTRFNFNWP
ncbi:hypothetical protein HRG_014071 [Hirsutella rhossiliensis]